MRLSYLAILIVVMMVMGIQTTAASRSIFDADSKNLVIKTCSSNPFLDVRKRLATPLVILDKPRKSDKVCAFEWTIYGTCCHENQILDHVNAVYI